MLLKKPLILILAIAFSVHCSNGYAQENSLSLLFVLAAGKALINNPKLFIEVSSRKGVYLGKTNSQVEEESETIEWWELKQEPEANDSDGPRVCFDDDILLTPDTRYCFFLATGVSPDSGIEAKAYSRAASGDSAYSEDSGSEDSSTSDESSDNCSDKEEAGDDSDVQYVTTTLNPFPISNEISQYCATLALKKIKQEPVSDSEMGHLETHKQPPHLPAGQRPKKTKQPKVFRCDCEHCNYSTNRASNLKRHKQTHLPADQKPRKPMMYQCNHEGCNFRTGLSSNLKVHKQTHLPADQRTKRAKTHQCDHEGCNYRTEHACNLKMHKKTHLPANQRPRMHQCGHQRCDYRTDHVGNLKRHKQIHLPADQRPKRPKVHHCHHEGCNHSSYLASNLNRHMQTHLPALRRPKRKANDPLPSKGKRKKGDKK
ncbi:hypothetical protein [Endozoicomonas sp. 4G]|uniref:hypothetical protein n=1 Tax=Endozoicomonas sp. 4G TaxID=2872754 RepID=UPI002078D060|nr:hypothetical protein [Endozoicomonas sp. 4G]